MGRIIAGVLVGYLTLFAAIFVLVFVGYAVLGVERSFQPDSWDVSAGWLGLNIALGLIGAMIGGYVCAVIAKDPKGPLALVAVVFVLGVAMAAATLMGAPRVGAPEIRSATASVMEAMRYGRSPTWLTLGNPLLGAIGVYFGGRLRKRD